MTEPCNNTMDAGGVDTSRWRQLSTLLDELFELEPAQQQSELEKLQRIDPELARRATELLQADAKSGLLEKGVAAAAPEIIASLAAGGMTDEVPVEESLSGRMIGRWRVLRELGRGGMGVVLLAERADGEFAQRAAVKHLKRGMDSDEILLRFAQERRILAALNHPNIARLLDAGMDADGRPFFAMEYIEGEPITEYARRHALSVSERLQLMQRVCETVAYAQSRLIVHRDLKPSNILVDGRGEPRLLDFGIAKLLTKDRATALTLTGARVLSPAYAAPEQLIGDSISTATDVYALGVLLFELLTGSLPHQRRGAASDSSAESLARETTELPSTALRRATEEVAARAYGERLPARERMVRQMVGDLDLIVMVALRHEPERRYQSAGRMAEDLRLFLDGRPLNARADSKRYRLTKFLRRHRVGVLATSLVLLSLLAGLGVALWQADAARRNAQRAEQVKNFVVSLLEASNPERVSDGHQMSALELVQHAAKRVEQELGDAPESQAELRIAIGESLTVLGQVPDGIALIEAGVAQLRQHSDGDDVVLGHALHQLAMRHQTVGRIEEAYQGAQEALRLYEGVDDYDPLLPISVRTTLAKLAGLRGDLDTMEAMNLRNLQDRTGLLGADDARLAVDWNNLAAVALRRDRYADAEAHYTEAIRVISLDPDSPASRMAWLRGGKGFALIGLGRFAEARSDIASALEIAHSSLHAEHPIVGTLELGLSALSRNEQRWEEAIVRARTARDLFDSIKHADQALAEMQLGMAYLAHGQPLAAGPVLERAVTLFAERRSREEPLYFQTLVALGLSRTSGDSADQSLGEAQINEGLAAIEERGFVPSMVYADSLGMAAEAAQLRGELEAARALLGRQREQVHQLCGDSHPRLQLIDQKIQALESDQQSAERIEKPLGV